MRVQPKTEAQIAAANLWPPGEYHFEVKEAEEAVSASGNEMIKLTVHVSNNEGETITCWDYLVDTERAAYKIRHFAEATGLLPAYERGELQASACVMKTGRCKIAVVKDRNGQYPDKNGISDYLKATGAAAPSAAKRPLSAPRVTVGGGDLDDEIPFGPCWQ